VVGGMMKSAGAGEFLVDAVKDMAKAGTRGIQGALVPGAGGALQPMSTDPRSWRAQYAVRVNTEKEQVLDILNEWKTKANRSDPDFFMNFDPVQTCEQSLTRGGQAIKDAPVPDQGDHEKKFELGMWKEWLSTYGYVVRLQQGYMTSRYVTEENQGKKIRDRINSLGENGDAWLEQYGGISRRAAEEEAARRNQSMGM
jgi:hypothetical protein